MCVKSLTESPTPMLTDPAGPPLAFPLLIMTGPLGPCEDLPVFNVKVPLAESFLLPAEALVITCNT